MADQLLKDFGSRGTSPSIFDQFEEIVTLFPITPSVIISFISGLLFCYSRTSSFVSFIC